MFVATISNVGASTLDLVANGINFDNTQFLDKEDYKQTPFVQKMFTKDNVFDESAFDQLYNVAAEKYKDLSEKKSYDTLEDFIEYDPFSASAPVGAKKRNPFVSYEKQSNPMHQKISVENFNTWSTSDKSLKELAQQHKIWNPETQKWEKDTPESLSFFDKTLGHSLSYAKYEETKEQINPVTGEMGYHEAGEWILDENGQVFTQYTPKTDLMHSEIVSTWDILTDEESWVNNIDVFDSDDLHKSTTGIVVKNCLKILPYLIPQTRGIWGAVQAAYDTMSAMPTLYKQLESLFVGDANSNAYIAASGMEHWFKKFEGSTTDLSKESFFNAENLLGLVSEVWGQIHQQKAAAKLGTTLGKFAGLNPKKAADVEKLSKLGQQMSLGYMALTGTSDVYNSALQAGYDNRTAAVAGLLSAGALFGIMNLNATTRGVGTWFLGPEDGVDTRAMSAITKVSKGMFDDIEKGLQQGGIQEVKKKFKQKLYNAFDDLSKNASTVGKASLNEALEETSEEIIQDAVKGIIDGASALGLTGKQGHFGVVEDVFSMSGLQRYLTTALGGAVGGGMFHLQQNYIDPFTNKIFKGKEGPTTTLLDQLDKYNLATALLEGRYQDIMNEIDRCKKFLPSDKFTGMLDQYGQNIEFAGKTDLTYADVITNIAKTQVNEVYQDLKAILGEANLTEKRLFDLESAHLAQLQAHNILNGSNEVILTKYLNAKNASLLTNVSTLKKKFENIKEDGAEKDEAKKEYENALKELKKHFSKEGFVNNIIEGYMITDATYASLMNPFISEENFYKTFHQYTDEFINKEGKHTEYKDLTPEQKDSIKNKLEIAKNLDKDTIEKMIIQAPVLRHMYLTAQEKFSKPIKEWLSIEKRASLFQALRNQFASDEEVDNFIETIYKSGSEEGAHNLYTDTYANIGLGSMLEADEKLNLLDLKHNYDLAEELIKSKVIKFAKDGNEEGGLDNRKGVNVLKALINQIARYSGVQQWSKNTLLELAKQVNKALLEHDSNEVTEAPNHFNAIVQLAKIGENPLTTAELMDLNIQINETNIDEFVEKNKFLKIKAVLELLQKNDTDNITEDEFNYILNQLYDYVNLTRATQNPLKNQLTDLRAWISEELQYLNQESDSNKIEQLEQIQAFTKNLQNKNIRKNPFRELFDFIHFDLYNEHTNIIDFLEAKNYDLKNLSIDVEQQNQIKSALDTIAFMKNIIKGMHMQDGHFSINGAIQGYIDLDPDTKIKKENFATINDDDFTVINMYLEDVQKKLTALLQLNGEMAKSKSEEFKKIREVAYQGLISGYENFENNIIKDIVSKVTREPEDDDEKYLFRIRTALWVNKENIFNHFEDFLKQLNIDNLKSHNSLKEAFDKKNSLRIQILDILASISVDPKEFLEKSKEIYTKETFDPRYDQEFIMHGTYAWVKAMHGNGQAKAAYNSYVNRLNDIFKEQGLNKTVLNNTVSIYGAAGSGKTAVAAIISKMLGAEVYVTSQQEKKVEDLKSALSVKNGNTLDGLIESELKTFLDKCNENFTKWLSANNNKTTGKYEFNSGDFKITLDADFESNTIINIKNLNITKKGKPLEASSILNFNGNNPKLLIFNDEVQLNSIFYNYLLNQTNIPIIRIGAHDQVGHSFTYQVTQNDGTVQQASSDWDESNYVSVIMPKLLGMYRADNSAMKEIVTKISANLNKDHKGVVLGDLDQDVIIDAELQSSIRTTNSVIKFYYGTELKGEKQFTGVKIDDSIDSNFINEYLQNENTVVISDVAKDKLPSELQKFEVKTLKEALGSEWDHVIWYEPTVHGNTGPYSATKTLYSGITRAKQGVYVIKSSKNSDIFSKAGFQLNPGALSTQIPKVTVYTPVTQLDIDMRVQQIDEVLKIFGQPVKKNVDDELEEEEMEPYSESENEQPQEDFSKEITQITKDIIDLEKTKERTEEDNEELDKLKKQQRELQEKQKSLGSHYDALDENWRTIQTFYRRGGENWKNVLDELKYVKSVEELKEKYDNDTNFKGLLENCNEDFGAFISLVAQGKTLNLETKPTTIKDNEVYWIGLFQRFILSNFTKAQDNAYYFWKKKYDGDFDALLYKENNLSPKQKDDDLYLLTFNYEGKRFTLGQFAYKTFKDDAKDFIAKYGYTKNPIRIQLNNISKGKIKAYINNLDSTIDRTCVNINDTGFYRVSGIRTFARKNNKITSPIEDGFFINGNVKQETLERYWMAGVTVANELTQKDANILRQNNSQTAKQYESNTRPNFKYRQVSMQFGQEKDPLTTAIRTEIKVEKVSRLHGTGNKKNTNLQKRHLAQLLDFYLNKEFKITKGLPSTKNTDFSGRFDSVKKELKARVKGTDMEAVVELLDSPYDLTNDDTVKKFIEEFNNKFKYFSYDINKKRNTITQKTLELSDAVIEPPTLLIVPSEYKDETPLVEISVKDGQGSNTETSKDPNSDQENLINQIKEKAEKLGWVLDTQSMELTSKDQDLDRTEDEIKKFLELIKDTEINIDFLVQMDINKVDDKLIDNFKEEYKELKCKFD